MGYSLAPMKKLKLLKWADDESQFSLFLHRVEFVKWKFACD